MHTADKLRAMFFISGLAAYIGLLIGWEEVEKANHISIKWNIDYNVDYRCWHVK